MKKIFAILSLVSVLTLGTATVYAQPADGAAQTEAPATVAVDQAPEANANPETDVAGKPMHEVMKEKFIEGGVGWMTPVLLCLILGLAIVIERIIYLNLATTNTKKLLAKIEEALNTGGVEAAKEVCRNTRGPVASIFYQGLDRMDEGMDVVEKSIVSYGSVQMGQLESGLTWVSLFISVSPMLGFMGTVVGMIVAFDTIQQLGDMSPTAVAGGIKIALLTTMLGLIVAVILQLFYNYILAKIDSLVINMEDSSITLVDILTKYNKK